ncbi:MAG: outer membrane beta-barrel protein [Verrucomicrobiota bacterium]|jgi:hypothetical protein
MKSKKTVLSHFNNKNARALVKALLLGLFALDRHAKAQDILVPPPPAPDQTPTAVQQTSEMDVFASVPQTGTQPFKWGALILRPHPYYQFLYADGVQVNTNQTVNTTIQQISPGALLEMGSHWTLDYSPLWTVYSNNKLQNTFGQAVKLVGGTAYNDWVFGISQGYTDSSSPSVETATQTRQKTYNTAVNAAYTMNNKMSLDLAANQNFVSADQFSSYQEWSTLDWLNYQFWPRLNAAVGVGGGYDNEDASPDMTFEQLQGRVNWRATDKISFQLHGGGEDRQFLSGGAADLINPVFGASIQYQPFEQTKISLTGERVVSPSYLQNNQVMESTGFSADLNQRLLGKLFLDLRGGYQTVKYISSNSSVSNRKDDYDYLHAQLSCAFLKRGTIAVFYQISRDDSSQAGYTFTSHQVGFQIGYSY